MAAEVHAKLSKIVSARQLHAFYSPDRLATLAERVASNVDFHTLAARWGMPTELAVDLSSLALFDVVLFCDDSGSMESEEGERIRDLHMIVGRAAEVATLFDTDGIEVGGWEGRDARQVTGHVLDCTCATGPADDISTTKQPRSALWSA